MPNRRQVITAAALTATGPRPAAAEPQEPFRRPEGFPYGDLTEIRIRGRLVHLQDEMARKYGSKVIGGSSERQLALATPSGELFTFLDTGSYRTMIVPLSPGAAVEASVRRIPRSMLIEVLQVSRIDPSTVRRTFHCETCNIDTEDWGPCVCCGKEMALVP